MSNKRHSTASPRTSVPSAAPVPTSAVGAGGASQQIHTAPTGPATSRGSMTSAGSQAAIAFLDARWRAVEAAVLAPNASGIEKPEVHQERKQNSIPTAASTGTPNKPPVSNTSTGGAKTGSPWGRRH